MAGTANEAGGRSTEQTVSHHRLAQTSALRHLRKFVKDHQVRLMSQDTLQQLHKPLPGFPTWLEVVTDNPSDTAEPRPVHLNQAAIEKSHAVRTTPATWLVPEHAGP